MFPLKKLSVRLLKKTEILSAVAVRLTKFTGKSDTYVHPKHLLSQTPWYIGYINKNDMVLDLGCGSGQSAIKAAKRAKKVIGLDFDDALLKLAAESSRRSRIKNVTFQKANLEENLKYKSNSFDKIIFLDVLEHLNNRDRILKVIKRILKNGGLLFLGVPNKNTSWKKLQERVGVCYFSDPDHKVEFSEAEIIDLLKKHGFNVKSVGYSTIDTPWRSLYDLVGAFSLTFYNKISLWRQRRANANPREASGFKIIAEK